MDRRSANRDASSALLLSALVVFIFGMTFAFAIFYIA
jgi:hypothetical protein